MILWSNYFHKLYLYWLANNSFGKYKGRKKNIQKFSWWLLLGNLPVIYVFLNVDARCLCCRSVRRDESVHLFHSEALFGPAGYRSDLGTHKSLLWSNQLILFLISPHFLVWQKQVTLTTFFIIYYCIKSEILRLNFAVWYQMNVKDI